MPYCVVSKCPEEEKRGSRGNRIRIFYQRYGHGSTKVLLIIGFAGTHDMWCPQIKGLAGTAESQDEEAPETAEDGEGMEVCCFDNRGIGRSSVPTKRSQYTTMIMANDALALMDHLGWRKAHIFGHSMGSMIASKLAAIAPERVSSLALLNTTGGGFECFPKIDLQTISLAFRFLRAKTPEQRAVIDLEAHYTKEYLDEHIGSSSRRQILHQEYIKGLTSNGMQSSHGFEGQINACWTHKLTSTELDRISSGGFLVSVIHGRDDIIAQLCHARRLAEKLYPAARMVELHGGHLVSHERPDEVNQSLTELIKASKSELEPENWSNIPENSPGCMARRQLGSLTKRSDDEVSHFVLPYNVLRKPQFVLLCLLGAILLCFDQSKRVLRNLKPVRVAPAIS